jgi:hypothetical protein
MDATQMQAAADRLAVKLEALELDADERAVLGAVLGAGASSIEPTDEVQGFAFDSYQWFVPGPPSPSHADSPTESLSLNFTKIELTYTQRH